MSSYQPPQHGVFFALTVIHFRRYIVHPKSQQKGKVDEKAVGARAQTTWFSHVLRLQGMAISDSVGSLNAMSATSNRLPVWEVIRLSINFAIEDSRAISYLPMPDGHGFRSHQMDCSLSACHPCLLCFPATRL